MPARVCVKDHVRPYAHSAHHDKHTLHKDRSMAASDRAHLLCRIAGV